MDDRLTSVSMGSSGCLRPALFPPGRNQRIQGELARSENQNDQTSKQKGVWRSGIELISIGKDRKQGFAISCYESHKHIAGQQQRNQARAQAKSQQNASTGLQHGYEMSIQRRRGDTQAGEKLHKLGHIVQVPPPGLPKLPSPKEAYQQQKRRLQSADGFQEPVVSDL